MMAPPMMHQVMPPQFSYALPAPPAAQHVFPQAAASTFLPPAGMAQRRLSPPPHQQRVHTGSGSGRCFQQCSDICAELPRPVLSAAAAEGEESESLFAMVSAKSPLRLVSFSKFTYAVRLH